MVCAVCTRLGGRFGARRRGVVRLLPCQLQPSSSWKHPPPPLGRGAQLPGCAACACFGRLVIGGYHDSCRLFSGASVWPGQQDRRKTSCAHGPPPPPLLQFDSLIAQEKDAAATTAEDRAAAGEGDAAEGGEEGAQDAAAEAAA